MHLKQVWSLWSVAGSLEFLSDPDLYLWGPCVILVLILGITIWHRSLISAASK